MWIEVWSWRRVVGRAATWYEVAAAVLVGLALVGAPRWESAAAPPPVPVYRVITREPVMALSINVVWGTEFVPQILSTLMAAHVPATFFVGGAWAAANPALVQQMVRDQMAVENHGYAHRHSNQLSFHENLNEIARAARAIQLAGAPRPTLYAPPYGEFNGTVLAAAEALHNLVILWTIDTIDWRPSSDAGLITARVLAKAQAGAIVLMHPTSRTLAALPGLVAGLHAAGYHLVTVPQLLGRGTPTGDG